MINRYVTAVGYERHVTPHMFSHSFGTLPLEENVDIRYIQRIQKDFHPAPPNNMDSFY